MQPFMSRNTINVKLIRYLDDQGTSVPVVQLVRALQVDRNTVKKHIVELQSLIQRHFSANEMYLEYNEKTGALFYRHPAINLNKIMLILTDESVLIRLVKSTFDGELHNLGEFNDLNFVSDSTVKRYVKDLQSHLALFGIRYSSSSHELVGDEALVRLCYYRVYWETYSHFEWPFPKFSSAYVMKKVKGWLTKKRIHLEETTQLQIAYWWVINTQRQRQGHQIELSKEILEIRLNDQPIYHWMLPLVTGIQEATFLGYCGLFFCTTMHVGEVQVSNSIQMASQQLLCVLQKRLQQELNNDDTKNMLNQLNIIHSYSMVFPVGGLILERDTLLQAMKLERPRVVEELTETLEKLQKTGNLAFQNQEYLLTNLVPLVLGYFDMSLMNPVLHVFLALDSSPAYRFWFQQELQKNLIDQYRVIFVKKIIECDLVVSNLDISVKQPMVSINVPLNKRDWENLKTFQF
ncbi:hypothetical protein FOL01_0205 [Weissella jogaejeotgali]|uniref:Mga helix-turn-helix domain-containing protein n=1 Tax=Weissella jogaejeotgali TaxID=1631871 RepID=A0A1L6R953_9LACO|nr:helix-turn-helix domain-containing protein [Weissella jogaejeotgali]APS41064.1 hypothetical protein FOL01_0205 [Weissella jogaejeotgali]